MRNQFLVYSLLASVSTATAGGTIGSAYGKDNGPAAVVKVAKSTRLSRYQRTITMNRSRHAEGLRSRPPENVTIDMRGITLLGQGPGSDAKSVTRVTGFKNVCLLGGRYLGKQDPQKVPWVVGHATYGAGVIFTGGSGAITVENAVIENSLQDGITLTGKLPNDVTFGMRGTHIKNNSDDGIQNDGGKKYCLSRIH